MNKQLLYVFLSMIIIISASLAYNNTINNVNTYMSPYIGDINEPYQTPPTIPATVYGSVDILCQNTSETVPAPSGLTVYAYSTSNELLASATTGDNTTESNNYILSISDYTGDVLIYVENVYVGTISVSPGAIINYNITVDESVPPTTPTNITLSPQYESNLTIQWDPATDNLGVYLYHIKIYNESLLIIEDYTNSTEYNVSNLSDGWYTLVLSAIDLSCNEGPSITTEFPVDTKAPLITSVFPANNSILAYSSVTIEVKVIENVTNITVSLLLDGVSINDYSIIENNGQYTITTTVNLSDGTHRLDIEVSDEAGHSASETVYFTVDTQAPVLVIDGLEKITNSEQGSFTVHISDATSGINWSSINVTIDSGSLSTVLDAENSSLIVSYSAPEGRRTITITVSDYAGNTANMTVDFIIDITPPIIDIVTPQNNSTTNNPYIEINASLSDNLSGINESSINIWIDGYGNVTNYEYYPSNGTLYANISLTNGEYTLHIIVEDSAGNRAHKSVNFTIDTNLPTIMIESPVDGSVIQGPYVEISITASDDTGLSIVRIELDGALLVECSCNGTQWTYTDTLNLSSGEHTLVVYVEDDSGNHISRTVSFKVDNQAPILTVSADAISNTSTNKIYVNVHDDVGLDKLIIHYDGNVKTVNLGGTTDYTGYISITLTEGSHSIIVEAIDLSGRTTSTELSILVDTTPPNINLMHPGNNMIINDSSVEIIAKITDNVSGIDWNNVSIILDNTLIEWSQVNDTTIMAQANLSSGEHFLKITASDIAGNTKQVQIVFYIDLQDPTLVLNIPEAPVTNKSNINIQVHAEDDLRIQQVEIYIDNQLIRVDNPSSGQYDIALTYNLSDGHHIVYVKVIDMAGKRTEKQVNITVDTRAPTIKILEPRENAVLNNSTVEVLVLVEDMITGVDWENVLITIDDTQVDWEFVNETMISATVIVGEGYHTITVFAKDYAGNSNVTYRTFIVSLGGPSIDIVSPTPGYYNSSSITIDVRVSDDTGLKNVTVMIDDIELDYCECQGQTEYNYSTIVTLEDGLHIIQVIAYDITGNKSALNTTFWIDTTPPSITLVSPESNVLNSSTLLLKAIISDNIALDTSTLALMVDGVSIDYHYYPENSTLTAELSLIDGGHVVMIIAKDYAGNVQDLVFTLLIDTKPPSIDIVTPMHGHAYNESTISLHAMLIDNLAGINESTIRVFVDNTILEDFDYDNVNGTLTAVIDLSDGEHTIRITVYDNAGNFAEAMTSFIIDTQIPTLNIIYDQVVNTTETTIIIHGMDNLSGLDKLEILVDGVPIHSITLDGAMNWTDTISLNLTEGEHIVTVRIMDIAGNMNETDIHITVDITPPFIDPLYPVHDQVVDLYNESSLQIQVIIIEETTSIANAVIIVNGHVLEPVLVQVDYGAYLAIINISTSILSPGENTVKIIATDLAYNTESMTYTFYADYDYPIIEALAPTPIQDNLYVSNQTHVELLFLVYDNDTWIQNITILVDNETIDNYYINASQLVVPLDLSEGYHTMNITITDASGKETSLTLTILVDTHPPELFSTSIPDKSIITTTSSNLTITLEDISIITNLAIYLDNIEIPYTLVGQGNTYMLHTVINFTTGGIHILKITAVDLAGNKAIWTLTYYVDLTPPILNANPYYIVNTRTITLEIPVEDDLLSYMIQHNITPIIEGPLYFKQWTANGTLILTDNGQLPENTPTHINITLTDPAGKQATTSIIIIKSEPVQTQLILKPGLNLVSLPIGITKELLQIQLASCNETTITAFITPELELTDTPENQPTLAWINTTTQCTLTIEGYKIIQLGETPIIHQAGNYLEIITVEQPADISTLAQYGKLLLYTWDTNNSKWKITLVEDGTPIIGDHQVLEPGKGYIAYQLPRLNTTNQNTSIQDTLTTIHFLKIITLLAALTLSTILYWKHKPLKEQHPLKHTLPSLPRLALILFLIIPLLTASIPVSAQSVTVQELPPQTITTELNNTVTLTIKATYTDSYQSIFLLELYTDNNTTLLDVEITVDDIPQTPEIETTTTGKTIIMIQDLQPSNGTLIAKIHLQPQTIGNHTLVWQAVFQPMTQLLPIEPTIKQGATTITVLEQQETTTTSPVQQQTTTTQEQTTTTTQQTTGTTETETTTPPPQQDYTKLIALIAILVIGASIIVVLRMKQGG